LYDSLTAAGGVVVSKISKQPQVNDYFGTFLESVKQASPDYPNEAPAADAKPDAGSDTTALTVLATLANLGPAMPVADLLAKLGISSLQAGQILSPLLESKFVTITGEPGHETVELTAEGARLTTVAK
jgi:hypothetical protein